MGEGGGGGLATSYTEAPPTRGCIRRESSSEAAPGAFRSAVGGGYCRLQMPLKPALGARQTVAGHRLGALEGVGGGVTSPPSNASLPLPPSCRNTRRHLSGHTAPSPPAAEIKQPPFNTLPSPKSPPQATKPHIIT